MSASSQTCRVNLAERGYDISIGADTLGQLGTFITSRGQATHAVVITDANVEEPHAAAAVKSLSASGVAVDLLVIDAGEETKSVEMADLLWQKMCDRQTDRRSIVVAVGGGVIGDLAGFVASTFTRGLRFFQVPTTLLAQVDSSVGGKVGVNLPLAKNLVGTFWQPRGVLIDIRTLETLPEREFRSGLAEVVKYGVIQDAEFFAYLEQHVAEILARDAAVLTHLVARCCRLKADVVEQDEREETGLRAILNYGHTYCHALEAITHYGQWLHGEAVAIGMLCASRLAERLGRIDRSLTERQAKLLQALGLPTTMPPVDREQFLAAMGRDKKVASGKLRFILPTRLGHVELVGDVSPDDSLAALDG